MAHDVFISYASEDKTTADAVCAKLEERGIRCWIAPRDVLPGMDWGEAIVTAIDESRLMVLVFSANSNGSEHVKSEVEMIVSQGKPVLPFRVEEVEPSGSLALHLSRRHWLDALTPPLEKHLVKLAETTRLLLSRLHDHEPPFEEDARGASAVGTIEASAQEKLEEEPAGPTEQLPDFAETVGDEAEAVPETRKVLLAWLRERTWVAVAAVALLLCVVALGAFLHQRSRKGEPVETAEVLAGELQQDHVAARQTAETLADQRPPASGVVREIEAVERRRIAQPDTHAGQEIAGPAGIPLVWVPGGKFMMGTSDGEVRERPVHEVELDGFWIGKTEVTVAQWRSVMGSVPGFNDQGYDHPVVFVTWAACQEFCQKTGLSLPTEAQWEYAARGPESKEYPWGNEWDPERLCWDENRGPGGSTFPVGSFPQGASWCGALDMAGNVWEWCADWHDEDYYRQSPPRNPTGPATGTCPVVRGGSWQCHNPRTFRCAYRLDLGPGGHLVGQGFRCARGL